MTNCSYIFFYKAHSRSLCLFVFVTGIFPAENPITHTIGYRFQLSYWKPASRSLPCKKISQLDSETSSEWHYFFYFCFLCLIIRNCSFWITMIERLTVRKRPFLSGVKEDTFFSSQKRKYPLKSRCSRNNNNVLSPMKSANCHLLNRKVYTLLLCKKICHQIPKQVRNDIILSPWTKFRSGAACLRIVFYKPEACRAKKSVN